VQAKKALWMLCALLLVVPSVSWTQSVDATQQMPGQRRDQRPNPEEEARAQMLKEMAKKANKERQEQLEHDTEKLLKLATELKQYVDKTNENVMSLEVLKKAEEIEKLAHSVKEKMKAN